jgi:hypothetical protein
MIPTSVVPSVSGWGRLSLVANMVRGHPGLVMPDDISPSLVSPASYKKPGADCFLCSSLAVTRGMGKICLHVFISQGGCTFICLVFAFSSVFAVLVSCQHSLCFSTALAEVFGVVVFIRVFWNEGLRCT